MKAIDLFAGAGGWDEGVRDLGITPLGIELDAAACDTRKAAGHPTLKADVAALDPLDFAPCDLLIASPPCQAFSAAGKGDGHKDVPLIMQCASALEGGKDLRAFFRPDLADDRSLLVVEPLRWALALLPSYVALEQVPPVLPLWKAFAEILAYKGYSVWTGVLSAETFGVPQTRKRAILMASRVGPIEAPRPTHQAYVPGEPAQEQNTLEGVLRPWVSMAEALGWGMTQRPTVTVAAGSSRQGGHNPLDGGSGSRATIEREREREEIGFRLTRGRGMNERYGERPDTPETEPAPTITSKARTADWVVVDGRSEKFQRDPRAADEPSATLGTTTRLARWYDRRQGNTKPGGVRQMVRLIPDSEPAPTIGSAGLATGRDVWVGCRPATTVNCDPRIAAPGHKGDAKKEPNAVRQMEGAVRVSIEEASVLQSFRADYPWQGSRSKQFEQVGNAVPPLMARAIVAALLNIDVLEEAA